MKALIIVMTLFSGTTVLCAETLDDMERSLLAEKRKEQEERQQEQRQREAKERQLKIEEQSRKQREEKAQQEIDEEKQRQKVVAAAEEERKRRYPIEQKKRCEYAQALLSPISFNVESYFGIQRSLRKYLHSASVTERRWRQLQDLQAHNDWLRMLQIILGGEMEEYPPQEQIRALVDKLKGETFHAEFLFTHHGDGNSLWSGYYIVGAEMNMEDNRMRTQRWQNDEARLIITFSIAKGKRKFIFSEKSKPSEEALLSSRARTINALREDKRLGRISQDEVVEKSKRIDEKFWQDFTAWMETSSIPDNGYPVKVREKANANIVGAPVVEKTKWIKCPDCGGSRYISNGQCDKCGGAGKYRTPVRQGLDGRSMGGRTTQCAKCKGKGEIKELCIRCRGRGKIKRE